MPTRLDTFRDALHRSWCASFDAYEIEPNVFSLATPFVHGDGDGYAVVCERTAAGWRLTDRGSYLAFLEAEGWEMTDSRLRAVGQDVAKLGCTLEGNEIATMIEGELDAVIIADFLKVASWLSTKPDLQQEEAQEQYRTRLVRQVTRVTAAKVDAGWHDPNTDPKAHWRVDARVEAATPVLLMAVASDAKAERTAATGSWLLGKGLGTIVAAVNPEARVSDAAIGRIEDMVGPSSVEHIHLDEITVAGLMRRHNALVG